MENGISFIPWLARERTKGMPQSKTRTNEPRKAKKVEFIVELQEPLVCFYTEKEAREVADCINNALVEELNFLGELPVAIVFKQEHYGPK
jgi:hypothetical protein